MRPWRVSPFNFDKTPYNSTGLLFTEVGGGNYRGSAAVARDKRLLYTCAHVLYNEGIWATSGEFSRAWSDIVPPLKGEMVKIRGYHYYGEYSGGNSNAAFALDFAICYRGSGTNFGPVLPVFVNGGSALRDPSRLKLIVGYPADLIDTGLQGTGYYYMHETGPFTAPLFQVRKSYHEVYGITTGPGNSGGPVVVYTDGIPTLAGMLISGSSALSGVHGLNERANTMADLILADLDGIVSGNVRTGTASNTVDSTLPDASPTYTVRKLRLPKLGSSIVGTELSLRINTSFRGDLDIYVRSAAGRIRWVQRHSLAGAGRDVVLNNMDYRHDFYGTDPNGTWQLFMRDFFLDDRATFKSASLVVRTPKP